MKTEKMNGEIDKLLKFAVDKKRIFIYGAGTYARRYQEFLENQNCDIEGFIVTRKTKYEFCGKKVFSVSEIRECLRAEDGIIPAFANSDPAEIQALFDTNVEVLDVDHMLFLRYITDLRFRPIIDNLRLQYGVCKKSFSKEDIHEILVIRTDAIGDLICTTPFIRELRKNYPHSRITVVIRKSNRLLLEKCPYIDELLFYDCNMIGGEIYEQCASLDKVTEQVDKFAEESFGNRIFDMVFLPRELLAGRNIFDDLLLAFKSGAMIRIAHVVETDIMKQYIFEIMQDVFTKISYTDKARHEVEYQLEMLRETGHTVENEKMELWVSDDVQEKAQKKLDDVGIRGNDHVIAVGFVASVPTRTWYYENYKKLFEMSRKLYGNRVWFLILGGDDAAKEYKNSAIAMDNVISLAGETTLEETISIIKKSDLYIGSNTGLLHMASACGVASITIYAELEDGLETDGDHPIKMGAWKVDNVALIPPAGLDGCHRVCRMGESHCINQITPDMVFEKIKIFINNGRLY